MENLEYAVLILRLTEAEGGGYMALVPDLHGCMADGETPAEALDAVGGAISAWLSAQAEMKRPIPEPVKRREGQIGEMSPNRIDGPAESPLA